VQKELKAAKGAEKKKLKERAEKSDKAARKAEKKSLKEATEKEKKKDKKKSKFSISLSVGDEGGEVEPLVTSSAPVKKGPRIIIAKEKDAVKDDKVSKRKLKQQKREKGGLSTGSGSSTEFKGKEKALEYLKTWSEDKENWKFEKCRQIWLLNHAYEPNLVPESSFPSLLQYLGSIQGGMREVVLRGARAKVEAYVKYEELLSSQSEEAAQAALGEAMVSESASDRALQVLDVLKPGS